jgi:hypothetical protein
MESGAAATAAADVGMIVMGRNLRERGWIEPQGALSTAPAQTHPGPPLTLTQTLALTDRQKYPARVAPRESEGNQPFRLMTRRAIFLPTVESQRSEEMNDQKLKRRVTPAEREALKVFGQVKTEKPVSEHAKAQKALHENRERLKSLRLAREAAEKAKET